MIICSQGRLASSAPARSSAARSTGIAPVPRRRVAVSPPSSRQATGTPVPWRPAPGARRWPRAPPASRCPPASGPAMALRRAVPDAPVAGDIHRNRRSAARPPCSASARARSAPQRAGARWLRPSTEGRTRGEGGGSAARKPLPGPRPFPVSRSVEDERRRLRFCGPEAVARRRQDGVDGTTEHLIEAQAHDLSQCRRRRLGLTWNEQVSR